MFTCFIRYQIAPGKLGAFKDHARAWIALIEKYGGTHHGYFAPGDGSTALPDASFSFPGLGREGPPDTGIALFSFPSLEAYERYRRDVAEDEACKPPPPGSRKTRASPATNAPSWCRSSGNSSESHAAYIRKRLLLLSYPNFSCLCVLLQRDITSKTEQTS
ncbi:MAG TPA: NIPSNAP family protein [Rhizomicrobium sp.]|nr:NIPSNAP family protein [Rhizomicrobium sp.]